MCTLQVALHSTQLTQTNSSSLHSPQSDQNLLPCSRPKFEAKKGKGKGTLEIRTCTMTSLIISAIAPHPKRAYKRLDRRRPGIVGQSTAPPTSPLLHSDLVPRLTRFSAIHVQVILCPYLFTNKSYITQIFAQIASTLTAREDPLGCHLITRLRVTLDLGLRASYSEGAI